MLTSSSPGILDNDKYRITINVEENAKIILTTQGYQRLFTMNNCADQSMDLYVQNNASFYFLPHPNVPHKGSSFSAVNNIYLKDKHDLLWSEIITCGRKLSGEAFSFTKFQNIINIYIHSKLVVKEIILVEPFINDVCELGQQEGYSHQSTLLFINDAADMSRIARKCRNSLAAVDGITFGISQLPVNGIIFRALANKAEKLMDCNNMLANLIRQISCLKESEEMPAIS